MIQRLKGLFTALSLILLNVFCQVVLAVDSAGVPADKTTSPATPPQVASKLPDLSVRQQAMEASMQNSGRLVFALGAFWLLVNMVRKFAGGKPNFNRPLFIMMLGVVFIYLGPNLVK